MSRRPRRSHSAAFKAKGAIEALAEGKTIAEIAQKHDVHPNQVTEWRRQLMERAAGVFGVAYSTFDWGIRDEDGYFYILGRTDDVINVAGHRLGTREIEESISGHPNVAEVAVVGVADSLKGQVAMAFVVPRNAAAATDADSTLRLEGEIMKRVSDDLGALARPARVRFVTSLPKTRSGKLLRRAIQAVCEQRDPGDLTTIEDPSALEQIKQLL